jgi:hypothetical protein
LLITLPLPSHSRLVDVFPLRSNGCCWPVYRPEVYALCVGAIRRHTPTGGKHGGALELSRLVTVISHKFRLLVNSGLMRMHTSASTPNLTAVQHRCHATATKLLCALQSGESWIRRVPPFTICKFVLAQLWHSYLTQLALLSPAHGPAHLMLRCKSSGSCLPGNAKHSIMWLCYLQHASCTAPEG